jgi:hypothetical protein
VEQAYELVQQFANPARERAPENSSTTGFYRSGPARSASCRGLF